MIMRVYEFAKKNNLSSKKIIEQLRKGGFEIQSHMSVLDDKALKFLTNLQKNQEKKPQKKNEAERITKKQKRNSLPVTESLSEKKVDVIIITGQPVNLTDFAQKIGKPVNELIITLLRWGIIVTKNQGVADDIIVRLAQHYGIAIEQRHNEEKQSKEKIEVKKVEAGLKERLPVVVV
ncbi:MAG: translation initiation factor IF-2 N-terminal domain-containing protein, partial [Candidatus Babeliales bacterium]